MTKILAFLFTVLLTQIVWADFKIPPECHVHNPKPGYCSFASLEILGRVHKIEKLYNLVQNRQQEPDLILNNVVYGKNFGYNFTLKQKLLDLKIKHWMQNSGDYNRTLLKNSDLCGCVVAVTKGAIEDYDGCHAIILVHYDEKIVRYYDCNKPNMIFERTRQWLDQWWTGLAIVIEKDK